jgi:hypothetical protein
MSTNETARREADLVSTIQKALPDFAAACASDVEEVVLHQDAFAADYQEGEYLLLGMAIKFAGLSGKAVRVTGMNRETIGEQGSVQ